MTVFLLEIKKKEKGSEMYSYTDMKVGESAEALKQFILDKYNVQLWSKAEDEFPWFKDGGFLYFSNGEYFDFRFTCYPSDLIKQKQP